MTGSQSDGFVRIAPHHENVLTGRFRWLTRPGRDGADRVLQQEMRRSTYENGKCTESVLDWVDVPEVRQ